MSVIQLIFLFLIPASMVVGFLSGAWRNKRLRWFLLASVASVVCEMIGLRFQENGEHNMLIYNLYMFPEFALFSGYAISRWYRPNWKIWYLLITIHAMILGLELRQMEDPWAQSSTMTFLFGSMVLPVLHFHLLWRDADQMDEPAWRSPHFWASSAIAIYYILMAPVTTLMHYLWHRGSALAQSMYYMIPPVSGMRYLLTIVAFVTYYQVRHQRRNERS
jgi:hypothetical protein